tara:strand:+ start:87 stop:935 length:849 start_codon:yes stop_codon:yes gene_type:complete
MILEKTINRASKILKDSNICSYELDAQLILASIMKLKREDLIVNNEINISKNILEKYQAAINRRTKGEPVAYILGTKEFWNDEFLVNRDTLIPRPETELMIYKIKDYFKHKSINILDIGTGSGCILLSILKEMDLSRGIGIDILHNAIKVAKSNSRKLDLINRSKFKVFNLDKFNEGKYDLIVSNPPYIPTKDLKNLSKDIIFYEPVRALDGGPDGLDLIKKVIYKSNYLLKRKGMLALEIGHNQYQKVSKILKYNGYREMSKVYDNNDNVRCIMSTKANFF